MPERRPLADTADLLIFVMRPARPGLGATRTSCSPYHTGRTACSTCTTRAVVPWSRC